MSQLAAFPVRRYSGGAIFFHWLMALMILFMAGTGLLFDDIPKSIKASWLNAHVLVGLAVLVTLCLRLWWRANHLPPPLPGNVSQINRRLSKVGHWVLYGLMLVVPLAGLAWLLLRGQGIDFGFFQMPPLMARMPEFSRPTGKVHQLAAYLLMALAVGHIAAALWHQYVKKDRLLARMILPAKPSTANGMLAGK